MMIILKIKGEITSTIQQYSAAVSVALFIDLSDSTGVDDNQNNVLCVLFCFHYFAHFFQIKIKREKLFFFCEWKWKEERF